MILIMNFKQSAILVFSVLLLSTSMSFAQGKKGKRDRDPEARLEKMKEHLQLSDAQAEQIKAIKNEARENSENYRENLKRIKEELKALKRSDNPDMRSINNKIDEASTYKAQIEKVRAASKMKVRQILTPEQRSKMDAFHDEKKEKRERFKDRSDRNNDF